MQRKKNEHIEWLEFELLCDFPNVQHQVFLRNGGVSEGPYSSLNVGTEVGDNPRHVQTNIQRIENELRLMNPHWERYVWGHGCHETKIENIHLNSPQEIPFCDGLITNLCNTTLMMKSADCQIALIYDPIKHVGANIHSGWRGSVANIYGIAIQTLQETYGSNPTDLLVCISPSLGPDEAEFISYQTDFPEEFWSFQSRPNFFDFWSISEFQLQSAGILPHHIEIAKLSTFCNPHDFFSYRRDKVTGRHAVCLTLL